MEGLDKLLAAAEGMVNAEQEANVDPKNRQRVCLNCSTPLTDVYCPHCGQKDIPKRQTLGELVFNFISSFSGYESKFFVTCRHLLFKPGYLATAYNEGKRERYFHPARMYAFISFIFFLLFFSLPDNDNDDDDVNINFKRPSEMELEKFRDELKDAGLDSLYRDVPDSVLLDSIKTGKFFKEFGKSGKNRGFTLSSADYETVEKYDSAQMAKPESERDGWLKRKLAIKGILLSQKYKDKNEEFAKTFWQSFMDHFSPTLFFLLPFFALLLKLLYVRRNYYYSEHLVLSICYYNFFYLAASLILLINLIPGAGTVSVIIGFWIYFYLLFAMKRMYNQSWRKTILKFVIFSWLFAFLMLVGVAINAMVTLMSI